MKNLHRFIWILVLVAICNVSCGKDDPEPSNNNNNDNDKEEPSLLVSQYLVYDGMAMYYLWNEQMLHREPTEADTDPKRYFRTLLDPIDRRNDWSWITDDVDALFRNFAGGESARVFEGSQLLPLWHPTLNQHIAVVRYVYPNSPVAEAGIRRGEIIREINSGPITDSSWRLLFETTAQTTLTVYDQNFQNRRPVVITPRNFAANSVLYSRVDSIGDIVIGYLFYTAFRSNFNNYLYQAFYQFKQAGVTDLVLDLRYNPGGGLDAAVYLASMIAPRAAVENQEILTKINYNQFVNAVFDNQGVERAWRLGTFNDSLFQNPLNVNLDLDRVYIITTQTSASASELVIFGLRPFMDVVHIGQNTSGKYTVSWTVHAFDNFFVGEGANRIARAQRVHNPDRFTSAQREELRNWAMQPIVGTYTDRDGRDFVAAGTLSPNHFISPNYQLNAPHTYKPIGNRHDFMFAKAISLITGQPLPEVARNVSGHQFVNAGLRSPQEEQLRRAVNVDNVEIDPEMLREMLRSLR